MNLSTSVRLLAGATLVASCALVPFWLTRPSRVSSPLRIVVLPQASADPNETEDPAAHWLLSRRYGSLLRYEGTDLAPGLVDAWERGAVFTLSGPSGRSHEIVVGDPRSATFLDLEGRFSYRPVLPIHGRVRVFARSRVEARYVFHVRTAAKTVAADENLLQALDKLPGFVPPVEVVDAAHVCLRTLRPSPDFERHVREPCPGVFGEVRAELLLTLRLRRRGGDPAPAVDLRNTLEALRKCRGGRYSALAEAEIVRADAREIVLRSPKIDYGLLESCTVPLAGRAGIWQAPPGVLIRSADGSGDVLEGLRSGRYSAAFLADPPEDLLAVGPRLGIVFGVVLNARLPVSLRRTILEVVRGKPGRLPGASLRILCRHGEPVSREEAISLWDRLRTAGAQAVVEMERGQEFDRRIGRRDFDLVVHAFPASIESEPRRWWRTSGAANLSGLSDPGLDALLDTLGGTFEEEDRFKLREKIRVGLEGTSVWAVLRRGFLRLAGRSDARELLGVPDR